MKNKCNPNFHNRWHFKRHLSPGSFKKSLNFFMLVQFCISLISKWTVQRNKKNGLEHNWTVICNTGASRTMVAGHFYQRRQIFFILTVHFFSLDRPSFGFNIVYFHRLSNFGVSNRPILYMIVHSQAFYVLPHRPSTLTKERPF